MLVKIEVDEGIIRAALKCVDKSRAPLPSAVGLVTLPETVENGFRETRAKRAGGVDILVSNLPPIIHRNRLVPYAPDKGSFLLGSSSTPSIFPVHICISRKGASPLCSAKVHLNVDVTDLVVS